MFYYQGRKEKWILGDKYLYMLQKKIQIFKFNLRSLHQKNKTEFFLETP